MESNQTLWHSSAQTLIGKRDLRRKREILLHIQRDDFSNPQFLDFYILQGAFISEEFDEQLSNIIAKRNLTSTKKIYFCFLYLGLK